MKPPKNIIIILPEAVHWSELLRSLEFFKRVNIFCERFDEDIEFKTETVASKRLSTEESLQYEASYDFQNRSLVADAVIIPSLSEPLPENQWKNRECMEFLSYLRYKHMLVIGTGALLLNDREMSEPIAFPRSKKHLIREAEHSFDLQDWFVEKDDLHSVADSLYLEYALLKLLHNWLSDETLDRMREATHIHAPQYDQRIFRSFNTDISHDDMMIQKAQDILHKRYNEQWNISDLAAQLYISRRQFDRRFKQATNLTAPEYLKRLRLQKAAQLLVNTAASTDIIADQTGYGDTDAFRSVFREYFGCSPTQYRNFHQ